MLAGLVHSPSAETLWPCSTDNTGIFRDIKKRGKRRVLELDPAGRKIVEASIPAGMRIFAHIWLLCNTCSVQQLRTLLFLRHLGIVCVTLHIRRGANAQQPGRTHLQVEQIGEAKVLWKKREFTTLLTVDEDERDPNELRTAFTLIRSVS